MLHRIALLLGLLGCGLVQAALPNCGVTALPEEALARLNEVRAAGHRCGNRLMPPALPVAWHPALQSAASRHSLDMASRAYFGHISPEGERVGRRAALSNYTWRAIGENLAGGDISVAEVMDGWLASPAHCANMLDAVYQDVGVACVQQPGSKWGTYWTMVLGRKR